jgi:hypothetical protein
LRKLIILLAGLILAFVPMAAASAHGVDIYNGNDYAHMGSDHHAVWIHDKECDGNTAWVEMKSNDGFHHYQWDHNGCGSDGGSSLDISPFSYTAFRICEHGPDFNVATPICPNASWHDA